MNFDVIQVIPQDDFTVYVYFCDGIVKLYDMKPFLKKGVFKHISDPGIFIERCTVLNNTLAWDISGEYDPTKCIDIAPDTIYMDGVTVKDPLTKTV